MAVFLGHGSLLLVVLRGGQDSLVQLRLESGAAPVRIWRVIVLLPTSPWWSHHKR